MLTLRSAKDVARAAFAARLGVSVDQIAFVDELTQCSRHGWLLFYDRRAAPVLVSHDGRASSVGDTMVSPGAPARSPTSPR